MRKTAFKQLPLGMGLRDDCTLETYYPGQNLQLVTQLKQMAMGQGEQLRSSLGNRRRQPDI